MVFGFTLSTPSVTAEIRSISWLPYEGPLWMKCSTSSGSTSRLRSSPVKGSPPRPLAPRRSSGTVMALAASRAAEGLVACATASRVALRRASPPGLREGLLCLAIPIHPDRPAGGTALARERRVQLRGPDPGRHGPDDGAARPGEVGRRAQRAGHLDHADM